MEFQINFQKIFDALISNFYFIIIATILSIIIGVVMTNTNTPDTYAATATIYSASYVSYRDSMEGRNAIMLYVDIVRSRKVAERASSLISHEIRPEQIMGMVTASFSENSTLLTIRAVSVNAETAVAVVNAVATAFVQEVVNVTAMEGVKILDIANRAQLHSSGNSSSNRTRMIIALGGAVLSIVIIGCISLFDKRAAFPNELTLGGQIELIGAIPSKNIKT